MDKIELSGLLNKDATIIEFNDHMNITGYIAEEVIGKNWFDIFINESNMLEVRQVFSSFLYGDEPHWTYDNYITCKDGTKKLLSFNNNIILNEEENAEYIFFTAKEAYYVFTTLEDI